MKTHRGASSYFFTGWLKQTLDNWSLKNDIHRLLLIKKVFLKSRIMHLSLVWVYYYYFLFFSQAPKKQKQKKQKCLPKIPKLPHPHNILYVTWGRQCGSASSQLGGIYWSTATLAIHPHPRRLVSTKPWCMTITPYFTIQHIVTDKVTSWTKVQLSRARNRNSSINFDLSITDWIYYGQINARLQLETSVEQRSPPIQAIKAISRSLHISCTVVVYFFYVCIA